MKTIHKTAALGLLMLPCLLWMRCGGPSSLNEEDDAVDRWVRERMKDGNIPGLSLAVVEDGEVVKLRGYGMASLELDVAASDSTVYPLASVTKSFTGAAVVLLAQEQRLSLDDAIGRHLDGLPAPWQGITVRRLLTHTSGLPDIIEESPFELIPVASTLPAAIEIMSDKPMQFASGTEWRYNQTNYALLQAMLEKLSDSEFPEFIRGRLLQPAGMDHTVFGGSSAIVNGRGPWYSRLEMSDSGLRPGGRLRRIHVDYPDFLLATGGLNSSVKDMVKWDKSLRERSILSEESLRRLWTPVKLSDGTVFRLDGELLGYALGWSTIDHPGHRAVWTSGGNTAAYHRYLDYDLSVIVLTNCQGSGPNALAEGVAGFYIPELRARPVFLSEPPGDSLKSR